MAIEAAKVISFKSWVGSSAVSIVRHHKAVVSQVLDLVLDHWALVRLRYGRQGLSGEVAQIILLVNQLLYSSLDLLTDLDHLVVDSIGIKGGVSDRSHKLSSLSSLQNSRVLHCELTLQT